jgi:hypothetical protein
VALRGVAEAVLLGAFCVFAEHLDDLGRRGIGRELGEEGVWTLRAVVALEMSFKRFEKPLSERFRVWHGWRSLLSVNCWCW